VTVLLTFAIVLLVAALVSERADRSVLSTAVLFLAAGFVLGPEMLGVIEAGTLGIADGHGGEGAGLVLVLAEVALFTVLFSDGMHAGVRQLVAAWRLPGRALLLGMPLVLLLTAVLAGWVVGLAALPALLVAAVLTPTDPVFASAIVGREEVPGRLRHLLNVESGINDGLALPVVLVLISSLGGSVPGMEAEAGAIAIELALGIAIGVAIPLAAVKLEQTSTFAAHDHYRPLTGIAIALIVYAVGRSVHGNLFLAAFAAGITIVSTDEELAEAIRGLLEPLGELLKLAALLLFGAAVAPSMLTGIGWRGWLFALGAILLVRPLALGLALWRSPLSLGERVVAGWFGPKGFASVVYGLLVLTSGIDDAPELFALIAVTVALSMVAHSSTDVLVARWFTRRAELEPEHERARDRADDAAVRGYVDP
jgi:NhaP-type Na+/H+ or K+/H+ antiporter